MHGYKNIICLDVARSEIYVSEWRQTLSASNSVEATPLSSGKCSGKEMRPRYLLPPPPPQGWRDPPQHVSEERERVKGSLKRQCRRVLFRRFFFPRRHPRSPPSSHIWQRGRAGEEEPLLSLPLSSFSRRRSGKSSFFSLPPLHSSPCLPAEGVRARRPTDSSSNGIVSLLSWLGKEGLRNFSRELPISEEEGNSGSRYFLPRF